MAAPNNSADSFAAILSRAAQTPAGTSAEGQDLSDGFPLPVSPHHRVIDTSKDPAAIEGAIAYDFTVKRGVFLIFKPYDSCDRCTRDLASGLTVLPTTGDYVCPHVNLAAYEAVVNKTLAGHWLFGSESEVVQKDGSIVVSLKWFEKTVNVSRKKRAVPNPNGPTMQQDEPPI